MACHADQSFNSVSFAVRTSYVHCAEIRLLGLACPLAAYYAAKVVRTASDAGVPVRGWAKDFCGLAKRFAQLFFRAS